MRIIPPSHKIMFMPPGQEIVQNLELAGRTCYKSEDKITLDSAGGFIRRLIKSGHHSVIEHASITVRFICDRGVSHELVRHRLASFSQESTRYANYSKEKFGGEITVIRPFFWAEDSEKYGLWKEAMTASERFYLDLIQAGARAEEARSVLPNSLKTEVVMTANIREWRHVLSLRCGKPSHPQMRELMLPLLREFHELIPAVFDDIYEEHRAELED